MGLASMFLGDQNPFSQWVDGRQNFLSTIGSGLMQGQNLQHGLQIAGGALPQAKQLDLQQAEKLKADALAKSQANYTVKMFRDKGFNDLADMAEAGAPMPTLMGEYFKRIQPQAPAAPLKGNAGDVFLDPVTYQPLASIPKAPEPGYVDLTDAQEIDAGLDPKFVWQRGPDGQLKQAGGGGVNVTTTLPASETERDKTVGKGWGEAELKIMADGQNALGRLGQLSLMQAQLADPGFYSGPAADQVLALKKWASTLGLDPEAATSMESFSMLSKQAALSSLGGSLGTGFSNADRDFILSTVPNLESSPQGNAKLIEIQKRMAQRQADIASFTAQYANEHGGLDRGFYGALKAWVEANPLFADMPKASSTAPGANTTSTGVTWSVGP